MNHHFEWSLQCMWTELKHTSHGFNIFKIRPLHISKFISTVKTIQRKINSIFGCYYQTLIE